MGCLFSLLALVMVGAALLNQSGLMFFGFMAGLMAALAVAFYEKGADGTPDDGKPYRVTRRYRLKVLRDAHLQQEGAVKRPPARAFLFALVWFGLVAGLYFSGVVHPDKVRLLHFSVGAMAGVGLVGTWALVLRGFRAPRLE